MKSLLAVVLISSVVGCGGAVRVDDAERDGGAGGDATEQVASVTTGGGEGGAVDVGGQGGGGEPPPVEQGVCDRMQNVLINGVEVLDAGGDDGWTPGEGATIRVHLFHASGMAMSDYPGVTVFSDNPYVWSQSPSNNLFGLNPEEATWLDVPFEAMDIVEPGTVVTLTVTVQTILEPCPQVDTTQVQVEIAAPPAE